MCQAFRVCHHSCRNAEGPTALSLAAAGTLGRNKHLNQSLDLGALLPHLGQALGVLFPGFVLLQLCSRYDPAQTLHQVVGNILEGMSSCLLGVGNGSFRVGCKSAEDQGGEWGEAEKGAVRIIRIKQGPILQEDSAEPLQEA